MTIEEIDQMKLEIINYNFAWPQEALKCELMRTLSSDEKKLNALKQNPLSSYYRALVIASLESDDKKLELLMLTVNEPKFFYSQNEFETIMIETRLSGANRIMIETSLSSDEKKIEAIKERKIEIAHLFPLIQSFESDDNKWLAMEIIHEKYNISLQNDIGVAETIADFTSEERKEELLNSVEYPLRCIIIAGLKSVSNKEKMERIYEVLEGNFERKNRCR